MGRSLVHVRWLRPRYALAALLCAFLPGTVSGLEIIVAPSGGAFTTVAAGIVAARPGDTVTVRAGTYNEAVVFPLSGSPVAGSITLQGEPGAILDGTGRSGAGITINNRNYIRVVGLTVRNFRSGTPMGISVEGSSSFIELRNNLIHNIERPNGNAHGIAFYGTAATPMTNIVVEGNEIRNCQLGQSESLVLNGNIDGFSVAGNTVHDNDNIGIDFIGFEGTGPAAQDQARNGVCVDNLVYNITSATNPTYGGDRSAGGIYVDGGRDIVIERNTVDNCDIGIEVASEHSGKAASNITVRNNFIARGYLGNILMGGYAADRGMAQNVVVVNNTTYQGALGEIELQYNCDRITIENNILNARSGQPYISNSGGNNTNVLVECDIYFGASNTSPGAFPDARARFVNPLLVGPFADLHLQAGSPAIDAGIDLGNDSHGQPLSGATDIDGGTRLRGGTIDIGAHEHPSVTAVLAMRWCAEWATDGIRVVWEVGGARASEFRVERSEVGSDGLWTRPLTERSVDGGAVMELDRSASPEREYWYRLVAAAGRETTVIGTPIRVASLSSPDFRLLEVVPSPGRDPVRIAFTLRRAATIEIDVFDVRGRRLVSLGGGEWPAGRQEVVWDGRTRSGELAPAGLYLVRCVYPGGQDRRTIVRLR